MVLTRDEVEGLSADLLAVATEPTGKTRLSDWLRAHAECVGALYASEMKRHFQAR